MPARVRGGDCRPLPLPPSFKLGIVFFVVNVTSESAYKLSRVSLTMFAGTIPCMGFVLLLVCRFGVLSLGRPLSALGVRADRLTKRFGTRLAQ